MPAILMNMFTQIMLIFLGNTNARGDCGGLAFVLVRLTLAGLGELGRLLLRCRWGIGLWL